MKNPLLLVLRLEGPLQSWGERARWDMRDTALLPTKSGIIGLLACAHGIPRQDPGILSLERALTMGVRIDRPGQIKQDFHTVSGDIITAEGKKRGKVNEESTLVSYRQYLIDASFLVVLAGPDEILKESANALKKPAWPYYLGRKACVPSRPVFERLTDEYSSLREALNLLPQAVRFGEQNPKVLFCELESIEGKSKRRDRALGDPARNYGFRVVEHLLLEAE